MNEDELKWEALREQLSREHVGQPPPRYRHVSPFGVTLAAMWVLSAFFCGLGVLFQSHAGGDTGYYLNGSLINAVGLIGFLLTLAVSTLSFVLNRRPVEITVTMRGMPDERA